MSRLGGQLNGPPAPLNTVGDSAEWTDTRQESQSAHLSPQDRQQTSKAWASLEPPSGPASKLHTYLLSARLPWWVAIGSHCRAAGEPSRPPLGSA